MAKIAIGDNNSLKFTKDLKEHWEKKGHEVKYEQGSSEYLAQWTDIYYIDTFDNNLHYLFKLYHDDNTVSRTPDWDNNKKPTVVVRALDWEIWLGQADNKEIAKWVDKIICIAPHIKKRLLERLEGVEGIEEKIKVIKPGVNLDKFTLKTKITDGFQLGMVLGDMWWPKNHMAGLDIFTTLYRQDNRWRLHIRGNHEGGTIYWKQMYDYYLESRGIEEVVKRYEWVEDMNQWYENIDILLHPGMKEAFCYAVGEALVKGIPVVCNEFYGSKDIWQGYGHQIFYQTHEQAIKMIKEMPMKAPCAHWRGYIEDNYSLERQLKETDEFLGI